MTTDDIEPGTAVETTTISGQKIRCTVIRRDGYAWLLDSPEHGYAICRWRKEFRIVEEKSKEPMK